MGTIPNKIIMENDNNLVITISQKISFDDIANMLISAFDPAVASTNYWCSINGYTKPKMLNYQYDKEVCYRYCDYPLNTGGAIILRNNEPETDEHGEEYYPTYRLTFLSIRHALELMADQYPRHFANLVGDNADGETADVLVQLAVLGDIVYG